MPHDKFEKLIIRQAEDRERQVRELDDKIRAAISRHGRSAMLNQLIGNDEGFAKHARQARTLTLAAAVIPHIHTN